MPQPGVTAPATLTPAPITVSIEETMHLTSLSRSTINRLITGGKIAARKLGRVVLVERASIVAFLGSLPAAG